MIEITRLLARQFRAVLRKVTLRNATRHSHPVVTFTADNNGLRVRSIHADVAVEYRQPGAFTPDSLMVWGEGLADFEGRKRELVTLATVKEGVQARWFDSGVPQAREFPVITTDNLPEFPHPPTDWSHPG